MFETNVLQIDENQDLKEEVKKLKESSEKVRKSLFAKHSELEKSYNALLTRLNLLESHICVDQYADQQMSLK